MATSTNCRIPDPLRVTGSNVADDWRRFREQYSNYEIASDLSDKTQEKRAAVFLTCIGNDAYDIYRAMEFEQAEDRKKLDPILAAFEAFCVGAVNVTYERYVFNRRVQESGERFETFLGDVRRLARSCEFAAVEESMIRDRIVVGIRDETTRHKLLQVRDLTLAKAIDICKASEAAGRQLKAMSGTDAVQALHSSRRSSARGRGRNRDKSKHRSPRADSGHRQEKNLKCKYCNRSHEQRKEACPAYGQTCRRCSKRNHFESVCQSKTVSGKKSGQQAVNELETDEELLVLGDADADRWHTRLKIDNRTVRFLLDCGATVNLLPESFVQSIGRMHEVRMSTSTIRMFDKSQLQTRGMITLSVQHPRTLQYYDLEFYVAAKHDKPLLGFHACRALQLLRVVEENICEAQASTEGDPSSTTCITETDVFREYADLFDGVGLLEGDVHLEIDPTVPPVQMPLRRLPIGVRDQVAAELQRLEANGIITPVTEPSPWISALLAVAKPDNRIHRSKAPEQGAETGTI